MRNPARFVITFLGCIALALTVTAGPERMVQSSKETKEVIPPPPPVCDWSGVYFGLHIGGEFGHSEDVDEDYNTDEPDDVAPAGDSSDFEIPWGYHEDGIVVGGQVGYNLQLGHFVLGPEFDFGYMDLDGSGTEPASPGNDTHGETDSDFYMTFRGRVGWAADWHGCWLLYATGGAIGVNYETKVIDDCVEGDCGNSTLRAHEQEISWGYTVGGGIERQINRRWSIKLEYLYFALEDRSFDGEGHTIIGSTFRSLGGTGAVDSPQGKGGNVTFDANFSGAETHGHILRAGLNFHF